MMAQFPSKEIARLSYEFRTLGLGFANIGGLLMTSGIPYDSHEGRAICGAISAIMTGVSYATSAEMAKELGPFPGFAKNREHMLRVMRNHRRAAYGAAVGYEDVRTAPVAARRAEPQGQGRWPRPRARPGTSRSRWAKRMAIAMPRRRSSRPPARSASSWIATPPASSPTSRW